MVFLQIDQKLETPSGVRRKSNSGYRKMSTEDRILLFLIRTWRRIPFEGLGILFGISHTSASNYYYETVDIFHETLVPRLLHPLSGSEIDAMTPADFKEDLPGARLIFDGTGFKMKSKENVLLSRLLYSAYHKQHEGQIVFGKWIMFDLRACSDLWILFQLFRQMVWLFFAPESLEEFPPKSRLSSMKATWVRSSNVSNFPCRSPLCFFLIFGMQGLASYQKKALQLEPRLVWQTQHM